MSDFRCALSHQLPNQTHTPRQRECSSGVHVLINVLNRQSARGFAPASHVHFSWLSADRDFLLCQCKTWPYMTADSPCPHVRLQPAFMEAAALSGPALLTADITACKPDGAPCNFVASASLQRLKLHAQAFDTQDAWRMGRLPQLVSLELSFDTYVVPAGLDQQTQLQVRNLAVCICG